MGHEISRRAFLTGTLGAVALTVESKFGLPRRAFADDAQAQDGAIVILHTNDVHCAVGEPNQDGNTPLGYAALASYLKDRRTVFGSGNVTLVDAGDAVQGKVIGTLTKGEALIDIMNTCGYEYVIPGNHEFDFGMAQFEHLVSMAKATYLSCNFTDNRTGTPTLRFKPYILQAYGQDNGSQTKIAYIGVTTPATLSAATPRSFWRSEEDHTCVYGFHEDESGESLANAVQDAVDAVHSEGADYVVLLAHLGQGGSPTQWRSDTLAQRCSGIDVVIDGHSHEEYVQVVQDKNGKDVIISQTGTQFSSVGQVVINPASGTISASTPHYEATLLREARHEEDPDYVAEAVFGREEATQGIINDRLKDVEAQTGIKVGTSLYDLYAYESDNHTWAVRSHETNLGDFVADAYLYYASNNGVIADLAIVNGGGVRANLSAGEITAGDLINVNPFNNQLCYTDVNGQDLLDALEISVSSYPDPLGDFLQVSEGLTVIARSDISSPVHFENNVATIDANATRRILHAKLYGTDIDPAKTYKLVSHSYYLIDGGGAYSMLNKNPVTLLDLDNAALAEYLKINLKGMIGDGYANPTGSGRITFQDGPDPTPTPDQKPDEPSQSKDGTSTAMPNSKAAKANTEPLANTGDDALLATAAFVITGAGALEVGAKLKDAEVDS